MSNGVASPTSAIPARTGASIKIGLGTHLKLLWGLRLRTALNRGGKTGAAPESSLELASPRDRASGPVLPTGPTATR
jgi:hypothetical protein